MMELINRWLMSLNFLKFGLSRFNWLVTEHLEQLIIPLTAFVVEGEESSSWNKLDGCEIG